MRVLSVSIVVSVLTVAAVLGSTVLEVQQELNTLSRQIEHAVQQKRAENGDAILATSNRALTIMGNRTAELRYTLYLERSDVELEQWLRENDTEPCFNEAFQVLASHEYLTGWDISWCAVDAYEETNADSQYTFHSHAQTIVREAARALRLAAEAYELHTSAANQTAYLTEELEYLRYLWGNYQPILQAEIDGHAAVGDQIAETLRECFDAVVGNVEYRYNYLMNTLHACLDAL